MTELEAPLPAQGLRVVSSPEFVEDRPVVVDGPEEAPPATPPERPFDPVKRAVDLVASAAGLVAASPVLVPVMYLVWRQDRHNPFYVAPRVGRGDHDFTMVKLRSMVTGADSTGVDSTAAVLRGDMSLVGPRPNVRRETDLYTAEERRLLTVKPGITDIASIVFADEADILEGQDDPDVAYNQLIRPGKSSLGLFYIDHQSIPLDMKIVGLTAVAIVSRGRALRGVERILRRLSAPRELVELAGRRSPLRPTPPPGTDRVVTQR